ncbi:MAG TPA: ABC transporter substrate-binding protein [Candidatus Aminicenantes bacterium]|nr:ABC transporter substrate-binding protein [Candidatus Aminicenantes bacterium]
MTIGRRLRIPAVSALALVFLAGRIAAPSRAARQAPGETPRPGGTLRIRGFAQPFNPVFDPARPSHYFITEQLYDGLVRFDTRFNPMPALAEYWTVSPGGKSITFYLRKGVRFHNGRVLTAEDVKYSLERLVRNRPGNTYFQYFTRQVVGAQEFWEGKAPEVSGFRAVDPSTFEILWTRPYVSGLYLLGMYYCKVLPKDLLESQGRNFFLKPVGTGPFQFGEWLRGPQLEILGVRLERNPSYFERKPYLAAVEYSPHFTDGQFEAGVVHMSSVTPEGPGGQRYQLLENNTLKTFFLALSCDLPPLDRPEVRRALALALDKGPLAEVYASASSSYQVFKSYIPPLLPGFTPRAEAPLADPDAAKLLLDRYLPESGRGNLRLELLIESPKTDAKARFARELGRQLEALAIRIDVRYLRAADDAVDVRTPYLKLLEFTMDFPDPENILVPLYHSRAVVNLMNSRYASPQLDALLERTEVEPGWEKRASFFREAEKILLKDTPAIPLFSERVRLAVRPQVRGVRLPALGFIFLDLRDVWMAP